MSTIILCAECQRRLQVPDNLLGQEVKCPSCGLQFVATATSQNPPPLPSPSPHSFSPTGASAAGDFDHGNFGDRDYASRRDSYTHDDRDDYRDEYEDDDDRYERRRRRRKRRDLAPHRGAAALITGIVSIVLSLFIPVIGIIPGIIAWVIGGNDLREMREGRMDPEGHGMSMAGYICGIIGTVISSLFILCCVGYFVFIFFFAAVATATKQGM